MPLFIIDLHFNHKKGIMNKATFLQHFQNYLANDIIMFNQQDTNVYRKVGVNCYYEEQDKAGNIIDEGIAVTVSMENYALKCKISFARITHFALHGAKHLGFGEAAIYVDMDPEHGFFNL
jgi:hypothetical protein